MRIVKLMGIALLAAACGTGGELRPQDREGKRFDGKNAVLRLRGVNNAAFGTALVQIRSLTVKAGEIVLADVAADSQVDLAKDHAWLLSELRVPEGAQTLDVTLVIDDGGGVVKRGTGLAFDSPCTTLRMKVPVALFAEQSHAVVHMDVERSLVERRGGAVLMPQLSIHP